MGGTASLATERHMMKKHCLFFLFYLVLWVSQHAAGGPQSQGLIRPLKFRIHVSHGLEPSPISGRMIVLLSPGHESQQGLSPGFSSEAQHVWFAAKEVSGLKDNDVVELDPDDLSFPQPLSHAPVGDFQAMALLDTQHIYAYDPYSGPPAGTLRSQVVALEHLNPANTAPIDLVLTSRVPQPRVSVPESTELVDFVSPSLSNFWGRPIHMHGIVLLPPGYLQNPRRKFPTVYWTHGFGGTLDSLATYVVPRYRQLLVEHKIPPMIYVFLDQSCAGGTHEFVDSVNNGPWGRALTRELIPYLESKYRMDGKANGRLLTGHSSGGWAVLWLMVKYPNLFGGSWATSPDPPDFRNFIGPNLRAHPPMNFYHKPDGSPWMLVRANGKDTMPLEDFARQERVLGDYGGQLASFEWVFSPRGKDGRPQPLFDRDTGAIDVGVAKEWEKYDIAEILRQKAATLRPLLKNKIRVAVGTADDFHLDEPVRLFENTFKDLGIQATFTYLRGRTHFDLYEGGLEETIAKEMEQVARPASPGSQRLSTREHRSVFVQK